MTKEQKQGELPDLITMLLGEGEFQGLRFGEYPDMNNPAIKYKKKYWWRGALRKLSEEQSARLTELEKSNQELATFLKAAIQYHGETCKTAVSGDGYFDVAGARQALARHANLNKEA